MPRRNDAWSCDTLLVATTWFLLGPRALRWIVDRGHGCRKRLDVEAAWHHGVVDDDGLEGIESLAVGKGSSHLGSGICALS